MIKELFLAIIIGAVLGLGVTGGYFTLQNKDNQNQSKNNNTVVTEPTLVPTISSNNSDQNSNQEKSDSIEINSPEKDSLLSTEKTIVSGITTPNSNIIIATASNTFIGQSNDSGKFSVTIKLDTGLNMVKISSISSDGLQKDTQINITYSTAKI